MLSGETDDAPSGMLGTGSNVSVFGTPAALAALMTFSGPSSMLSVMSTYAVLIECSVAEVRLTVP